MKYILKKELSVIIYSKHDLMVECAAQI